MSDPGYIEDAALVAGWPAYRFAKILRRHWQEETEDLPLAMRGALEDDLANIDRAGRAWADRVLAAKARGSAEAVPAEMAASSSCKELSTEEVASMLQLTERRIRQLAGIGELPGRRDEAGHWTFDQGAVLALRDKRTGGAK